MKKKLKEVIIKMKAETKSVSKRRKPKLGLQSAESMEIFHKKELQLFLKFWYLCISCFVSTDGVVDMCGWGKGGFVLMTTLIFFYILNIVIWGGGAWHFYVFFVLIILICANMQYLDLYKVLYLDWPTQRGREYCTMSLVGSFIAKITSGFFSLYSP